MKITANVFSTLVEENFYSKYSHLGLPDVPNEDQTLYMKRGLYKLGMASLLNENTCFCFAIAYSDIKIETHFDILFPNQNLDDYLEISAILKYVNVNPSYKLDYLPKGYSGICLIEFEGGKPDLLNKLKVYGEERDETKHDTLYLSQRPILDRILELMKER